MQKTARLLRALGPCKILGYRAAPIAFARASALGCYRHTTHVRVKKSSLDHAAPLRSFYREMSSGATTYNLDSLGDSITTATLLSWQKSVGSQVKEDDVVAVVETDKVTMDIRAKASGTLVEQMAKDGDEIEVGKPLYKLEAAAAGATKEASPAPAAAESTSPPAAAESTSPPAAAESTSPPAAASSAAGPITVNVPSMGDSITQGTIAEWAKKEGDMVAVDDVIAMVETDKVTVDVRSQHSGKIVKHFASVGDTVDVGNPLYSVDVSATSADAPKVTPSQPPSPAAQAPKSAEKPAKAEKASSPAPAPSAAAPAPAPSTAAPATKVPGSRSETRVKMTRMRLRIAERLKEAQNTCAMLTTFQECDMSALMGLRKAHKDEFEEKNGVKLGFMSAFVKASTMALKELPAVNAYIDDETKEIVYRDYCDISVAVASPSGLVVPVLRNTEHMSFADIEKQIGMYGKKAKEGKLALEDMAGGTFTISNGGVFGSLMGTPIINPPQSAILGMHATKMRAVVVDGQVVARPMMYLALTYDHRLIDGREAVIFLKSVAQKIEDPTRLVLEI